MKVLKSTYTYMKRKYIKYIIYIYTHEHTHINTHTHTHIYIYIYIPIEKALKKYAVNALEEDHVRAFCRKKDPA